MTRDPACQPEVAAPIARQVPPPLGLLSAEEVPLLRCRIGSWELWRDERGRFRWWKNEARQREA